jgi:hypothetical protein
MEETTLVLKLEGSVYVTHGVFRRDDTTTSALLQDFTVSVDAICDAQ